VPITTVLDIQANVPANPPERSGLGGDELGFGGDGRLSD
jgi:hypothetical protein